MARKTNPKPGTFEATFADRLDEIERRGRAVGLTMTHICREAGTARATPDRWRNQAPLSVKLMDKMEAVVAAAEKKAAP